jgi:hypothetical protein
MLYDYWFSVHGMETAITSRLGGSSPVSPWISWIPARTASFHAR